MTTHTRILCAALTLLAAAFAPTAHAQEGNAAAGQSKNSMCIGCHGIPGYKSSFPTVYSVPYLGGQNPKYLQSALQAYQKGDRPHPTMRGIAGELPPADMADLAAYYGQPAAANSAANSAASAALAQHPGKAKAESQCTSCHAQGQDWSKTADPSYPKLAGQHADYLQNALKEYQNGSRKNAIMNGMAAGLSKEDMQNLSDYFSRLPAAVYLKK